TNALFVWKNRVVIFTLIPDLLLLQGRLRNAFPGVDVRLYHDLFYAFRRDTHCESGYTSPLWEDIILTADLVADSVAQQRYFDYHARQFTDWPEVSAGFCRADFQQLLLFRNGRQLMLVIRIPKGKTLAEIDPLTTKDNPRMDEWNRIMRGFQTGIKGTAPGETWVFLNRVPSSN
ncbi:MAG: L-rhamnose mutarotase, partial [Chitinophagaceae bacterium]|nr:L-rhamnose mutarotase [Chitinophagaceae bacterium]